ncbi:unnamed protein product [Effrenium voratum]|nr:unnamed protein product [Effrenium voratum]
MRDSRPRARKILPQLLLLVLLAQFQAFCNAPISVKQPAVKLAAEAKKKERPAVDELRSRLAKVLGRETTKEDVVWRYQATLELPCLQNFSSTSAGQVTFDGLTSDECRRKAAAAVLAAIDFEKLQKEATELGLAPKASGKAKTEKAPKAKKAKGAAGAKKAEPEEGSFEIGQEVEGKVVKQTRQNLRVDLGGLEAVIPAAEICDGFPSEVPALNSSVKARVLSSSPLRLTLREGSLERLEKPSLKVNIALMEGVDSTEKLDAEVVDFSMSEATLRLPRGDSETLAFLPSNDFADGLEIKVGSKVQVRRKFEQNRRVVVSMLPPNKSPEDVLKPGDELEGSVESILRADRRPAAFVDVGFDRPAYLDWQETADGWPEKVFRNLKIGKKLSCRVIKIMGDRIYITRRSGDLERLSFRDRQNVTQEVRDLFAAIPEDQWMDAQVQRLYPKQAVVVVKAPDGTEAEGLVLKRFLSEEFLNSAAPNQAVKVRRLAKQNKSSGNLRVMLTMKEVESKGAKTSEPQKKDSVSESATSTKTTDPLSDLTDFVRADKSTQEAGEESQELKDSVSESATSTKTTDPLSGLTDFLMR